MKYSFLGIITARGGSKSIPHKNIAFLRGKPLIAWTIEAALKSRKLERTIVSTDNKEIAEVSEKYGSEIPFFRPAHLALDNSPHIDVVIHAIEWLRVNENYKPEYIMLLQPTSPFRTYYDIDSAVQIATKKNADSVISVCDAPSHPYKTRRLTETGILIDFINKPRGYLPRQVLPKAYHENGAIYLIKTDVLTQEKDWYTNKTYPYIMDYSRSLDIDIPWDLYLANLILNDKFERSDYWKDSIKKKYGKEDQLL